MTTTRNPMTNAVAVIDMAAKRSSANIRKGQRAWTAIRGTAAEQRFWWLDVGTALIEGKALHPSNQAFGKWCEEAGFDMDRRDRADAMWLAENPSALSEDQSTAAHPHVIRLRFNEQQADKAMPSDAPKATVTPTAKFDSQRDAEKFIKTYQRAQSGDEGAETAKRMADAVAKKHGTTAKALFKAAAQQAPDMAYRFNPTAQKAIDGMRTNLRASCAAMQKDGIPLDAIKDLFINFANSL